MIKLNNVKKSYEGFNGETTPVLDIDSMHIKQGEQVAITGPSGCGKSTLLHIIGGVINHDDGDVIVADQRMVELDRSKKDQFRAKQIGYVFQDFHLLPSLNCEENVLLAFTEQGSKREREKLIKFWFERVGLSDKQKTLPMKLSRGQQQRVALIRAVIHEPAILLADEPTGSLDVHTARDMMNLMLDVCRDRQMTFLCVTHDLALAQQFPRLIQMQVYNKSMKQGA